MSPTRISVGGEAPVFRCFADLFDGRSAAARRAELVMDDRGDGGRGALHVTLPDREAEIWPLSEIRAVPDQAGADIMVLRHRDDPVLRVVVDDPEARRVIRARAPRLHRRPPARGKARLLAWAAAAVASVALIVAVLVPTMADQLARYLPPDGERALGDAPLSQIRSALSETGLDPVPSCDGREGLAFLSVPELSVSCATVRMVPREWSAGLGSLLMGAPDQVHDAPHGPVLISLVAKCHAPQVAQKEIVSKRACSRSASPPSATKASKASSSPDASKASRSASTLAAATAG